MPGHPASATPFPQEPSMPQSALFELADGLGIITLNRPEVHNAISLEMIRRLADQLARWREDDQVHAILLQGAGERAFCAGGDVRALHDDQRAGTPTHGDFFSEEYRLDYALWRFPKPIVALMDGITMGGGMGLAQAAAVRIATNKTRIAMPETGIGLIPDVGGTFFLSRMPAELALYIGLTGTSLYAADARYCGLADLYIQPDAVAEVRSALQGIVWSADDGRTATDKLRMALAPLASPIEAPPLAAHAADLLQHFGQPDVPAILRSLHAAADAGHEWAGKTLALLRQRSSLSMAVVHRQLELGRRLDLADCFRLEYNLVMHAVEHGDFMEGVRALLVDKDKQPRWNPPTAEELDEHHVAAFFAGELDDPGHPLAALG